MTPLVELFKKKSLVERYLALYPPRVSVCHFSSLVMWSDHFDFVIEEMDGCLYVAAHQPNAAFLFWPLIGPLQPRMIHAVMEQLRAVNPRVARIENIDGQDKAVYEGQGLRLVEKYSEYIYLKEDLIAYRGNRYKSQRHDVNALVKHHHVNVAPFSGDATTVCLDVFDRWAQHKQALYAKDAIALDMLNANRRAHELALLHSKDMGLSGIIVEVNGKIRAYSLGYPLNPAVFVVLLEVCDPAIRGLSAFIFNQMCRQDVFKAMTHVNAMDDFHLPRLAQAKKMYHPVMLNPIFNAV